MALNQLVESGAKERIKIRNKSWLYLLDWSCKALHKIYENKKLILFESYWNHADFHGFWDVKKCGCELHTPIENFLDVVWTYDKIQKCSPNNYLSIASAFVVIRQLKKAPNFLSKNWSSFQYMNKTHPLTPPSFRRVLKYISTVFKEINELRVIEILFLRFLSSWTRDTYKTQKVKLWTFLL